LEFNQSEGRKPISSLVNFASIDQNPIQSQSQSLVWYGLNKEASVYTSYTNSESSGIKNKLIGASSAVSSIESLLFVNFDHVVCF